jgi:methylamine dehydrogenase accessory protein MauD
VSATVYVAVIALWVVTLALGVAIVALARQIGVIHQRLAPVGALMTNRTLKVGERSPPFSLPTLDGVVVELGAATPAERASLLVFVSPQCPVCAVLVPAIRSIAAQEAAWLRVLLVADAPEAEMREFQRTRRIADIPLAISPEIGVAFRIAKLPYAVLLDEHSVITAQGLVNTRENLESLFEAQRLGVASGAAYRARQAGST